MGSKKNNLAENLFKEMTSRSMQVFKKVVETYLETGDPVGSRTLSRSLAEKISAATVRNVLQDLEILGLLGSTHVSSGRMPTQSGLRLFVDGFLEVADMNGKEKTFIEKTIKDEDILLSKSFDRVGSLLSGLTKTASVVLTPKIEAPIKHIDFVSLSDNRGLVVLVTADGKVENRIFEKPFGLTPSAIREAANFLNNVLKGRTIAEVKIVIEHELENCKKELDETAQKLVKTGSIVWDSGTKNDMDRLIIRGRSNLIGDTETEEDLGRIKQLFDDMERKRDLIELLNSTESGEGIRVFIGSENKLFSLSGSSLVFSPYTNAEGEILGAIGVIGPTRLNYGRIVPIVDYTAQILSKLIEKNESQS